MPYLVQRKNERKGQWLTKEKFKTKREAEKYIIRKSETSKGRFRINTDYHKRRK